MPALPRRPSTTIARRCAASCTDRTLQVLSGFHAFSLSKSRAATPDPYRAAAHSVCSCHPAGVCYRRISPVAPRPREGPLTEPTAGAQPWPRERVLMVESECDAGGFRSTLSVAAPFVGRCLTRLPVAPVSTPLGRVSDAGPGRAIDRLSFRF